MVGKGAHVTFHYRCPSIYMSGYHGYHGYSVVLPWLHTNETNIIQKRRLSHTCRYFYKIIKPLKLLASNNSCTSLPSPPPPPKKIIQINKNNNFFYIFKKSNYAEIWFYKNHDLIAIPISQTHYWLQSGTVFQFVLCCGGKVTWSALTPTHVWILTTKMGDHHDLPFKAEYAKSGRSSCKACKSNIGQGSLRLAVMVQVGTSLHFVAERDVDRCWYRYT